METYKIGNKINCIIRSYSAGQLGSVIMEYGNQPYTVLRDVEGVLRFSNTNKNAKVRNTPQLVYQIDKVSGLQLSNVPLTSRILNLIYNPKKDILCNTSVNIEVEPGDKLKLTQLLAQHHEIYQVFVYNIHKELITAVGTINPNNFNDEGIIDIGNEGGNFLVFYSYLGSQGYELSRTNNVYLSLDLEIHGNESNDLNIYYIHLDKCSLSVDKNMYFRGASNTIDLNFTIMPSEKDYITIK